MPKLIAPTLLLIILLTTHCSRKLVGEYCPPQPPLAVIDITLQLNGQVVPAQRVKITWADSVKQLQRAEEIGLEAPVFNPLLGGLLNDTAGNKFLYVLYTGGLITQTGQVTTAGIRAVAVYYREPTHYRFRLYLEKNGRFEELAALTGKTWLVTNTSLNEIARKIVFPNGDPGTLVFIDRFPPVPGTFTKAEEPLYKRIEAYTAARQPQ